MAVSRQISSGPHGNITGSTDQISHRKHPLEFDDKGRSRFRGCSNIRDYEVLGKLGEGTFGYDSNYILLVIATSITRVGLQGGPQGKVEKEWINCRTEKDPNAQ